MPRLELSPKDAQSLIDAVFSGDGSLNATAIIGEGIEVTNMTGDARGFSPEQVVTFIIENYQGLALNVAAAAIYDLLKGSGSVLLNGRPIAKKEDVEKTLNDKR